MNQRWPDRKLNASSQTMLKFVNHSSNKIRFLVQLYYSFQILILHESQLQGLSELTCKQNSAKCHCFMRHNTSPAQQCIISIVLFICEWNTNSTSSMINPRMNNLLYMIKTDIMFFVPTLLSATIWGNGDSRHLSFYLR